MCPSVASLHNRCFGGLSYLGKSETSTNACFCPLVCRQARPTQRNRLRPCGIASAPQLRPWPATHSYPHKHTHASDAGAASSNSRCGQLLAANSERPHIPDTLQLLHPSAAPHRLPRSFRTPNSAAADSSRCGQLLSVDGGRRSHGRRWCRSAETDSVGPSPHPRGCGRSVEQQSQPTNSTRLTAQQTPHWAGNVGSTSDAACSGRPLRTHCRRCIHPLRRIVLFGPLPHQGEASTAAFSLQPAASGPLLPLLLRPSISCGAALLAQAGTSSVRLFRGCPENP